MSHLHSKKDHFRSIQNFYDLMADEYDTLDESINPFDVNGFRTLDQILELLRTLWKGCRVLDLGCGTGIQTLQYSQGAKEVIACDISSNGLQKVKRKAQEIGVRNIDIILADACNLPLNDGSVDYVSAYGDVIGHIDDYEGALAEMSRVCRTGGFMTIEYENKWHLGVALSPKTLIKALRSRGRGDERIWTYEYLNHDLVTSIRYKTFTFPEMLILMTKYRLKILQRFGVHVFSSIVPEKYHAYSRSDGLLFPIFAKLSIFLGHVDRGIKSVPPFYRLGFTNVIVAQKV